MEVAEKESVSGLDLFFQTLLKEIYWCELHLRDVLETMEERASTDELSQAFRTHHEETNNHVSRLEKIFYLLGIGAQPVFCVGMQGLFDEGWQVIDETQEGSAHRDAALIVAAQKVEHYEMAAYGSLATLARTLNFTEAAKLLEETLAEEKQADSILTELAEKDINADASMEPAMEKELPPSDTNELTTESEPAIEAMKDDITGLDASARSKPSKDEAAPSGPGSADALLADDSGQIGGNKRSSRKGKK